MNKRVANSHRKGYPLSYLFRRRQIVHLARVIVQEQVIVQLQAEERLTKIRTRTILLIVRLRTIGGFYGIHQGNSEKAYPRLI